MLLDARPLSSRRPGEKESLPEPSGRAAVANDASGAMKEPLDGSERHHRIRDRDTLVSRDRPAGRGVYRVERVEHGDQAGQYDEVS